MKPVFSVLLFVLFFSACVRIPVQSVMLADAIQTEGERMHKLNLALLNNMFATKKKDIEKFAQEEYLPTLTNNLMKGLSAGTDYTSKIPDIVQRLIPVVNAKKDSLTNALDLQKEKLTAKLNQDYAIFETAATELKKLLESAVKVDKAKAAIFDRAKELSNNKIDLKVVEMMLDNFIHASGSVSDKINTLNHQLDPFFSK